jgi:hypothetical protein
MVLRSFTSKKRYLGWNKRLLMHELRTLFWECTLRCNAACLHCGSDCRVSSSVADMPAADFLRVIDEITPFVNPNKLLIIFTGGEALLRPDLEQCGRELYRRGYPWGIVSNGLLFSERLERLLSACICTTTTATSSFAIMSGYMVEGGVGHPQHRPCIARMRKSEASYGRFVNCWAGRGASISGKCFNKHFPVCVEYF